MGNVGIPGLKGTTVNRSKQRRKERKIYIKKKKESKNVGRAGQRTASYRACSVKGELARGPNREVNRKGERRGQDAPMRRVKPVKDGGDLSFCGGMSELSDFGGASSTWVKRGTKPTKLIKPE